MLEHDTSKKHDLHLHVHTFALELVIARWAGKQDPRIPEVVVQLARV